MGVGVTARIEVGRARTTAASTGGRETSARQALAKAFGDASCGSLPSISGGGFGPQGNGNTSHQTEADTTDMSRVTRITDSNGKVTTIVTRSSGCGGCLTILAAVVVLFGPAAWFPGPLAVMAYVALGVVAFLAAGGWLIQQTQRTARTHVPAPPGPPTRGRRLAFWLRHRKKQPPPVPLPPPVP
jgi:hypothetical protein